MKLIDLLNENMIEEGMYSVTVDLMGPMKVQVKAKDEKEAKKIVASKLQRGMRDVKKVKKISEGLLNEEQKYEIKTRFGKFTIVHDENTTGPGFDPEYFVEVNLENQYLGHFMIAGDPRDKGAKGKITIHKGKKVVKLGHDK